MTRAPLLSSCGCACGAYVPMLGGASCVLRVRSSLIRRHVMPPSVVFQRKLLPNSRVRRSASEKTTGCVRTCRNGAGSVGARPCEGRRSRSGPTDSRIESRCGRRRRSGDSADREPRSRTRRRPPAATHESRWRRNCRERRRTPIHSPADRCTRDTESSCRRRCDTSAPSAGCTRNSRSRRR